MSTNLNSFIRAADNLVEFEQDFNNTPEEYITKHTIGYHQEELKALWRKCKTAHETLLNGEEEVKDIAAVKKKHKAAYGVYIKCSGAMSEIVASFQPAPPAAPATPAPPPQQQKDDEHTREHNIRLPPCDTEVFKGDYVSWPSFRDMFTAIYILNKRLTPVEKLFHLNAKTSGEAKDIVKRCPLTNDGFVTAWKNLSDRYENKRILINTQLKILFNLTAVETECGTAIKNLQREINNCISSLQCHQIDISNWDAIITYLCSTKLPECTLALWEQSIENKSEISKWEDMDRFLSNRFQTLETVSGLMDTKSSKSVKPQNSKPSSSSKDKFNVYQTSVQKQYCKMCNSKEHGIRNCSRFKNLSTSEKISFIKNNNSCLNCLSSGHTVSKCTSSFNCSICHARHHTLLHIQTFQPKATNQKTTSKPQEEVASTSKQAQSWRESNNSKNPNVSSCHAHTSKGVLLGTARVHVHHNGVNYSARALIDSGSECSFMTERLRRKIHLPSKRLNVQVSGINNTPSARVKEACQIQLRSLIDHSIQINAVALVLPQLTGDLPTCHISPMTQNTFPDLDLADKRFFVNEPVDLILGGDLYPQIILEGIRKNVLNTLIAQETVFGWILTGRADAPSTSNNRVSFFNEIRLEKQLANFWELEEIPKKKELSPDNVYCEELFKATTKRGSDGKYIVSLPFRHEFPTDIQLGPSLKRVCSQFYRNETRLTKTPSLQNEYNRVLSEYETLGHMQKINSCVNPDSTDCYFLPHHAVIKEESTTTKVRVVFNASCPTSNGKSLNDVLHPGPILQADLTILILQWRLFKYVFNSDIEKMYRQIWVHNEQTKFQRLVFRTNPNEPIRVYELKTVTFGVNCAPYLAIRTLHQLADDIKSSLPIASNILRTGMYVDDVLSGGHTIEATIKARDEINTALKSAGFNLRKWTSNSNTILKGIPKSDLLHEEFLEFEDTSAAKTLGIRWNAHTDHFYFSTQQIQNTNSFTKREILSAIAKLFDPLGWLAPVVIMAKIIMQNIWLEGTDWDEEVSSTTLERWHHFMQDYPAINQIRIPRWVHFTPSLDMEIHGFCDASEKAYAAAVYLRVKTTNKIHTNLLLAKTRVAPVKTISLPRLELCGAVLLAEIIESVVENLQITKLNLYLWTDSTIVLAWIRKPPCSWSTFVAHRITKIIDKVGNKDWRHVDSASNPADLGSRGLSAEDIVQNSLWWQGPSWLQQEESEWPPQDSTYNTSIEAKKVQVHTITKVDSFDILERFSDFSRALRVITYIFRFSQSTHPKTKSLNRSNSTMISPKEIKQTMQRLIKLYQGNHFQEEIEALKCGKTINTKSEILSLNPFIDNNSILRAGGRLKASLDLAYNERHPIILPYDCRFSRLLVQFIHKISLHGENQLMLRFVRTQYWIPRVKNMIRSVIHNCKVCIIHRKRAQSQLMGNLPSERITFSRPFTNTGVDFAGPFDIKSYSGRGCRMSKGYVCLFVCFSTKAIHLEATSDLSTASFLAAFDRFIARRGCPKNLYSDNGTNFVGASRALRAEFKEFVSNSRGQALSKYCHQNMEWHFIPAATPHMGGLWEAGVKSFKTHFKKLASDGKFTIEEFATLLCRIESCLNSRPLSPISNDPSNLEPLTPGHFLVGGHLLAPPEIDVSEHRTSIVNRWEKLKALHQTFCQRWKSEYLHELQKRNKWKFPKSNLKEGDLVVIKEDNLPPNEWRLGRVSKVHPGADDKVRVVVLDTSRGQTTRAVSKIILLPPYDETAQNPQSVQQSSL